MKAIISPYEPTIDAEGETVYMPSVVVDFPSDFTSSDMPASIPSDGERLIMLSPEAHTLAVAAGWVEVDIVWQ